MNWPIQRLSEHHLGRWMGYPGYDASPTCCCGWIGDPTGNALAAFALWDRHADHYRRTDGPCTRGETS